MIIIGADEAGFGPNLGPLMIAATCWRVPDELIKQDLYTLLERTVCREPSRSETRLAIADSKLLYKSHGSWAALETAVYSALAVLSRRGESWQQIFHCLAPDHFAAMQKLPWYSEFDASLPRDANATTISTHAENLTKVSRSENVELLSINAVAICPAKFNRRVRQLGSKGALLTEQTLMLIHRMTLQWPGETVMIYCDKHGGRNRYGAALQHVWPDGRLTVGEEARRQSNYRLDTVDRLLQIQFAASGESQLPCAWASLAAKYLRELAMWAFNDFWQSQLPDLRPTAGYPQDAKRFRAEIQAVQRQLGIEDDDLWRCR